MSEDYRYREKYAKKKNPYICLTCLLIKDSGACALAGFSAGSDDFAEATLARRTIFGSNALARFRIPGESRFATA